MAIRRRYHRGKELKMNSNITVIVPMYNVEKYIKKCLSSISDQTYINFEVFAINDGSTDKSSIRAKKIAEKDKRIKVIDKENGGYGTVLEYAIKKIKTEYFLICDPDDWLEKSCLEKLYIFAKKNNADIVVGDRYDVYVNNEDQKHKSKVKPDYLVNIKPKEIYSSSNDIQLFSFFQVSPHAKLYKTNLVRNVKFPKHVSYTDFLLYMAALSKAKKVAYYNEPLADYLQDRPGNTATSVRKSIINDYVVVWNATFLTISDCLYNNILLYRLYVQLRLILSEYNRVIIEGFNNKYWNEIINAKKLLQKKKEDICIPYFENNILKRLFFKAFMSKNVSNLAIKLYIKLKKVERKNING